MQVFLFTSQKAKALSHLYASLFVLLCYFQMRSLIYVLELLKVHDEWFNPTWDLQIWQSVVLLHKEDSLATIEQLENNCTPICEPCESGRFFAQALSNEGQ
jgi:hypothetical protein